MKRRLDPLLPIPPTAGDDPAVKLFSFDWFMDRLLRRLNELFREFGDGTIAVFDESVYLGQADGLNFVGSAVTASANTTIPGTFDITITGGSGSSAIAGVTVLDEGITQGAPAGVDTFNFVGVPVQATVTSNVATIIVTGGAQQPIYVYFP